MATLSDQELDIIVGRYWPRTTPTAAMRQMMKDAADLLLQRTEAEQLQEEAARYPVASYRMSRQLIAVDLAPIRELAEKADQDGDHYYNHPRDSNNWKANDAWLKVAAPELFLRLLVGRNLVLEDAAKVCDTKFALRSATGHIREASAARSLAEEIRGLKTKE